MAARIIDGAALAARQRESIRAEVVALRARGTIPGLAVVIAGDDPASRVYVRNKIKACEAAGIASTLIELPTAVSQVELLDRVAALNADAAVHGILVQLPLPGHLDAHCVIEAIAPAKDVDGFHLASAGALMTGLPGFVPCTPAGVMALLRDAQVSVAGSRAVVLGRSNIVGKPLAMLLLQADATVTICHSRTRDLAALAREADILIAAIGRANFVTQDLVKPGACVIDVGINRDAAGKLVGDVDFAAVAQVAGVITPVPGGVGPMTIAMLLANTLKAAQNA
jgi:methylenetetrahydrofolate dehydrogenase (NADP+)/methenyltetrahydrofolate cyclohydrolase